MVSLWFEEMDDKIRLRQYDIHNVRFTRDCARNPVQCTFQAPKVLDSRPSVPVQDEIDAFNAEDAASNISTPIYDFFLN